jgi:hypothetical protein
VTTVGRSWKLWAYRYESGALWHVGARKWVQLHGLDRPLVPVLVEEILGDRYAEAVTHYGWQDREDVRHDDVPAMIQVRAGDDPKRALMLLATCVGIDGKNDGRVVALRITERECSREESDALKLAEERDQLRSENQRLAGEVSRLQAENDRLTARASSTIQVPSHDDAATRFSLLELD